MFDALAFLSAKRDPRAHTASDIEQFVQALTRGEIPDYQTSAWLMAVRINGLTSDETAALTLAMRDSGALVRASERLNGPTVDKHSTGGVGDKTTLIVIPLLVACGFKLLKMSGRGLGITGGTIDKLESIPGVRTALNARDAIAQASRVGAAIVAASKDLAPADGILYALRNATATVDSIPLIAASIMSKKLAAGAQFILLDVKVGSGAFMGSLEAGRQLATRMIEIGQQVGVSTSAVISDMDVPLGRFVGNSLEVREAVATLLHPDAADPRLLQLCIYLVAHCLVAAGMANSHEEARQRATQTLSSGAAAEALAKIIHSQGGPANLDGVLASLPQADVTHPVTVDTCGRVSKIDAYTVGEISLHMGAGRVTKQSPVDHSAGIEFVRGLGSIVQAGDVVAYLYYSSDHKEDCPTWTARLRSAITIEPVDSNWQTPPVILDTL